MACCPAHNDNTPSLSLKFENGKLLLNCFAGCEYADIVSALKERGLWDDNYPGVPSPRNVISLGWQSILPVPVDAPAPPAKHSRYGKPSMYWSYHDTKGELLGYVYRFDTSNGKQVVPLTFCTDGKSTRWTWQAFPEPRPLYGQERINGQGHVVIVEGEKAADAAWRLLDGVPVLTWPGGSNAVKKADWHLLAEKTVCIWPDADEPGNKAAIKVAELLGAVGVAEVKVVEPPEDVEKGWDLADAEDEGWGRERVLDFLRSAIPADAFRKKYGSDKVVVEDVRTDPVPLPDELLAVEPFDFDLLPETLGPWVRDVCERVQCAPDFIAVATMVALGSLIGRKVGIRPQGKTDWTETANQWGLVVGRPGVLKSPAIEQAVAPLKRLAAKATEAHSVALQEYEVQAKMADLRATAAKKNALNILSKDLEADLSAVFAVGDEPVPVLQRYLVNDTTAAALGELHCQNHNGLLVFRDEMVSLLRSLDREDHAEARGFYLTGWNGNSSFAFDRIGRGLNLHIPAVCLSLLGGTQPTHLAKYVNTAVKGGYGDDGLIQRFGLLVWPDTDNVWKDVDRCPDADAKRRADRVFDYLDQLQAAEMGAEQDKDHDGEPTGQPFLRFSEEARGLFLEWRVELEERLRGTELHPAVEIHLSNYRKLVPGLALILHLANGDVGPVSVRATLQSLAWAAYLESHAMRVYGSVSRAETTMAKAILKHIRKGDLQDGFTGWQVWRPGWSMLSDREQVQAALQLLVDYGYLFEETLPSGGRPKTIYHIHPAVQS